MHTFFRTFNCNFTFNY